MTIHPNADDFGPPRRKRRPTLSEIEAQHRAAIDAARAKGRALTAKWYFDNPLRRHYARPALQDEVLSEGMPSFPKAILCTFLTGLEGPTVIQLFIGASIELVDDCRQDKGETFAAALFELGKRSSTLVRDEIFTVRTDGSIQVLGVAQ